ncbi:MAG: flippase-like domain-containing protein [Tagaea sp.]|nr:flippase-like domain-containing protein [Tagaea sp.]
MADPAPSLLQRTLRWAWIPITVAAILGLALLVDWRAVGRELAEASPIDLALMMGLWAIWLCARPMRMRTLVRATGQGDALTRNDAFGAHAVGLAVNNLLPMRAGEVAMIWLLRRRANVPAGSGASAVVLDRFCDLIGALGVLTLALLTMPEPPAAIERGLPIFAGGLLAGLAALSAVVALRGKLVGLAARILPGKLVPPLGHLLDGLAVLGRPAVLLQVTLWTASIWGLATVSFHFGVRAVWPEATLAMAAFLIGVVALAFLVPAAPGGVGVFHAASVFALSVFGVPAEAALAYALLTHALTFLASLAVALVWVLTNGLDPRILTHRIEE